MKLSEILKDWPEKMKNNHDEDGCELCDSLCDDNPCESAETCYNADLDKVREMNELNNDK